MALACVGALGLGARGVEAASLSGTVLDVAGAPLFQMEVTLWRDEGNKRWEIVYSALTDQDGAYAFEDIDAGTYKLHARMGPLVEGNYADRWYDVEEPTAEGYVGADADEIAVGSEDVLTDYDFVLPVVGGMDGYVTLDGSPVAGMQVRMERASEPRIHHNDMTQGPCCSGDPHLGRFYLRGMPPAEDYRVLVHDPDGNLETAVVEGPLTIQSGVDGNLPEISMAERSPDPYEPNDAADAAGSSSVDGESLHDDPPEAWDSVGSTIRLRGEDVDWHCFDVEPGDRLLLTVLTTVDPDGVSRESPWMDPILGLWTGDGSELLMVDDDSGPGQRESFLDVGPILTSGQLCAVVSTYGDTTWSGLGQESAGGYTLRVEMGNRPPTLGVTANELPVPVPPATVTIAEAETVVFGMTFTDPDHDALVPVVVHEDNLGGEVADGVLDASDTTATYTWVAHERAAEGSPYTLAFSVSDGEFTAQVGAVLEVAGVNRPPSVPIQLQPANASTVRTEMVTLLVENAVDADGDALVYELEAHYGDPQGEPDQSAIVDEDPSGQTGWTTAVIPDNTAVQWRTRAFDGNLDNGYSPWTDYWLFVVNTENSVPSAPMLLKPADGEEVLVRQPTLSVRNSSDAEDDAIVIMFEVAQDAEFSDLVTESPAIAQSELGSTTDWRIDTPLDWGRAYYARAFAADDQGGVSEHSNVNRFHVKENQATVEPGLLGPFATQCEGYVYQDGPPDSVTVANVEDPEGEAVTFQLQIFEFDDDPGVAEPLVDESVPQDEEADVTVISFDSSGLEMGGHYRVRVRAYDGTGYSTWSECDFYVGEAAAETVEVRILVPEPGTIFPRETQEVRVEVQNAFDPTVSASEGMDVAYCASQDPDYGDCALDPARWDAVAQSSLDPEETTVFTLTGLEPAQSWWLRVCGRRPDGQCGPEDTTNFSIESRRPTLTPSCGCDQAIPGGPASWMALMLLLSAIGLARGHRRPRT